MRGIVSEGLELHAYIPTAGHALIGNFQIASRGYYICTVLTTRVTDKEKSLMLPSESKNAACVG